MLLSLSPNLRTKHPPVPCHEISHNLLSHAAPVGGAGVAAGAGEGCERYDLVDLAPRDFHFDGWVQEVRRCHDELQ